MAKQIPREPFLADLRARIGQHVAQVETVFAELDDAPLAWKPAPKEWSILQCFEHLVLTYDYYRPKLERALAAPTPVAAGPDGYAPSGWGRVYMYFSLNPRYSFPAAEVIAPGKTMPDRAVFAAYLEREAELLRLLDTLDGIDLTRTRIPVEKGVRFNLGDVLKILVYHDEVHFLQAQRVLDAQPQPA
jgi:hypothetical protein